MTQKANVVICGAGICGVAAAYFLSKAGIKTFCFWMRVLLSHLQVTAPPNAIETGGPAPKCSR